MKRIAFLFFVIARIACGQNLRVGVAEVDITPPPGAPMAGYYINREATGTHDPLHVKAIVLEQDGTKVAMVACDLVSLPRDLSEQARTRVAYKEGNYGPTSSRLPAGGGEALMDSALDQVLALARRDKSEK